MRIGSQGPGGRAGAVCAAMAWLWLGTGPALPQGLSGALVTDAIVADIRAHLDTEIVLRSVANQNRARSGISPAEVERLDTQWRAELKSPAKPLIAATLANPLSNYLTRLQAHSLGLYCEIIVMDAYGLNVAQSNITSDYWQGDEAKWQRTYSVGPGTVFIDDAEWNDESKTWRAQVNLTIESPGEGVIGAATFEINLTELQRRERAQ
ncbi:hypothetical protein [Acuticoccus kandeliae]|uniref:hypothetical protein n=1 Tax=Acuticoccus kandeliae TaxID=2073160 RepID=UPI001FE4AF94|nr:hypothetical protein [Acuticoccus kandeliae]